MKLLEVLIERKANTLNRPFSYVYEGDKPIDVGFRVLVPFAHKDVIGYVVGAKEENRSIAQLEEDMGFRIDKVKDVLDDKPLLNEELLQLSNEIADHYLAPLISVLQTMLPSSLKPASSALRSGAHAVRRS